MKLLAGKGPSVKIRIAPTGIVETNLKSKSIENKRGPRFGWPLPPREYTDGSHPTTLAP